MVKGKTLFAAAVAVASLSTFASTSQALVSTIFTETTDAGQTLTTADVVPAADMTIDGSFANPSDADLYQITISNLNTYTFSTLNARTNTSGVDTELFLFDSAGHAVLANDDANGTTIDSSITDSLAAGTYFIGVSSSGNEPINSNSQLLFVGLSQSGDTTAVRGPASGVNPTTLATFNSNEYDTTTSGNYEIGISAPSTVPEPSTWAVVGASCVALAFLRRRRVA